MLFSLTSTTLILLSHSLLVQSLQSLPDFQVCALLPRQTAVQPWQQRTMVKQVLSQFRTTVEPSWDCPLAVSACLVSHSSLIGLVLRMVTHSQQQLDSVWVLRPSHCLPVLVVEFTPRLRTLVLTLSVRSKPVFLKMTHETLVLLLTTLVTTSVTLLEWVLTSSNRSLVQSLPQ